MKTIIDSSPSLIEITQSAIRGDTLSLGTLFQYYRPRLYAHALRVCGNTALAQDAVQDTFISAYTHISSLRDPTVVYPWLRKMLFNNCYMLFRKEKSLLNRNSAIQIDTLVQDSIDQNFEQSFNQQIIYELMSRLSDELSSCLILRYFSHFNKYDEIALLLGVPIGTVRSRLAAAREKLSKLYHQTDDAGDRALNQSNKWSSYYQHVWTHIYDDHLSRNEFFNHLNPMLNVRFTSGKSGNGRGIFEKEINDDLTFGSRFNVKQIASCGNISVVEGINSNNIEYPDRCSPSSVFVVFRQSEKISDFHIFDSSRII